MVKIKGWRKKYPDRDNVWVCTNPKTIHSTILYRMGYGGKKPRNYYVASGYKILKSDMTRGEARKYAISWMKRHPRG